VGGSDSGNLIASDNISNLLSKYLRDINKERYLAEEDETSVSSKNQHF